MGERAFDLPFPSDPDELTGWPAFHRFHSENPHVYELFEKYALEAARAGRGRFGAWMIWNRMRWYVRFETTDHLRGKFKLNNNLIAYYARFFQEQHPELPRLFATRRLRDEDEPA